MTEDDMFNIAQNVWYSGGDYIGPCRSSLKQFVKLIVAAEREAILNILWDYAGRKDLLDSDESLLKHLVELIRARGET